MDDKLLILEDTNGDGKADKRTVFAGNIDNPTGFEFWNGGVIVAQAPNLVFLKDTNGDDKYNTRQILLGGMDSADTQQYVLRWLLLLYLNLSWSYYDRARMMQAHVSGSSRCSESASYR